MTVAYATGADLQALTGQSPPADADRQLERASELLDFYVAAQFDVDTLTSLPTDTTVAETLRDAACAVVEAWAEVGEENDVDGLAGTQVSVGQYSGSRAPTLPPRAQRILATAGLLTPPTRRLPEDWPR